MQILNLLELDTSEMDNKYYRSSHKVSQMPLLPLGLKAKWDKGSFTKVVLWGIKFQLYYLEVDSKSAKKKKKVVSSQEGRLIKDG